MTRFQPRSQEDSFMEHCRGSLQEYSVSAFSIHFIWIIPVNIKSCMLDYCAVANILPKIKREGGGYLKSLESRRR